MNLNPEYQKIIEVVKQAGERLMFYWPGGQNQDINLNIEKKKDGSIVTRADFESNELILNALQSIFPDDGILSEEIPPDESLSEKDRLWVVDPLDGTQSFADGNSDFSILVGLVNKKVSEFGIMYFPAENLLALGTRGQLPTVNSKSIQVSENSQIQNERVYIRKFTCTKSEYAYPRWMDSGRALLAVAKGEFDGLIIKLEHHKQWDLAAPSVLIELAGGKITDEDGNDFMYTAHNFNYKYFVASNGKVHDELLNLIPR